MWHPVTGEGSLLGGRRPRFCPLQHFNHIQNETPLLGANLRFQGQQKRVLCVSLTYLCFSSTLADPLSFRLDATHF